MTDLNYNVSRVIELVAVNGATKVRSIRTFCARLFIFISPRYNCEETTETVEYIYRRRMLSVLKIRFSGREDRDDE